MYQKHYHTNIVPWKKEFKLWLRLHPMAGTFYPAEDYHQDYYIRNPLRYKFYRYGCGRDSRLEQLWGN